jgi:hypothetical protein
MQLEWDLSDRHAQVWGAGVLLGLLLLFGWIGSSVTRTGPDGLPRLIGWSDWRLLQAEQAFRAERAALQLEVNLLIELLNTSPDPVRAQMTADRITRQYASGQPALSHQRLLVVQAAQAVLDWTVGVVPYAGAQQAVTAAVQALKVPVEPAPDSTAVPSTVP